MIFLKIVGLVSLVFIFLPIKIPVKTAGKANSDIQNTVKLRFPFKICPNNTMEEVQAK